MSKNVSSLLFMYISFSFHCY